MKATDIKMYISTLSIIKKGQEIECGDFLGGRKVNASQAWIMYKVSMKMHWRKRKVLELERRLSPVMKETTRHYSM